MTGQEWVEGNKSPWVFSPFPKYRCVDPLTKGWATYSGPEKDIVVTSHKETRLLYLLSAAKHERDGHHTALIPPPHRSGVAMTDEQVWG